MPNTIKHTKLFYILSGRRLILLLISLMFVLLFINLSIWQFERAQYKTGILNKTNQVVNYYRLNSKLINNQTNHITKQNNTNTKTLGSDYKPSLVANLDNYQEYSPVELNGYFDNKNSIYLTNQYNNHKLGYHLITPFITHKFVVLVDRGWLPKIEDHNSYQNYKSIKENTSTIIGLVRYSNSNQYIMGDNLSKILDSEKYKIQKIDLDNQDVKNIFPYKIESKYLQLLFPSNQGFALNWQWTNIPPEKHQAYAIQWLLLAFSVILLYSYFCYKTLKEL